MSRFINILKCIVPEQKNRERLRKLLGLKYNHLLIDEQELSLKGDYESIFPNKYSLVLTEAERILLINTVKDYSAYLEFGCGGSTFEILKNTSANITSVESDRTWVEELKKWVFIRNQEEQQRLHFIIPNFGKTGAWGWSVDEESRVRFPEYSQAPFQEGKRFEVVFVDGRCRVACAVASLLFNTPKRVIIHDFWNRPQYWDVLNFYQVYNRIDTMAVLEPKPDYDIEKLKDCYEQYKYDQS